MGTVRSVLAVQCLHDGVERLNALCVRAGRKKVTFRLLLGATGRAKES
jgi:hypothetical protein